MPRKKNTDTLNTSRDALYDRLLSEVEQKVNFEDIADLGNWATSTPIILDGQPFSFHNHEYLKTPYCDDHPDQAFIKAAQLGLTSLAMLRSVYGARYGLYRGILYLFPSRTDVTDFAKSRLDALIEDNPETIGTWIRSTDSANLKKICNCFMYLRGMKSRVGLKSVPADFEVFDEMDEAPQEMIDMALERMGHSITKHVLKLSNPTLTDFGIDSAYQLTDQRRYFLKCPHCRKFTDPIEDFPMTQTEEVKFFVEKKNGDVIRACHYCRKELDISKGEWVAKYPKLIERRGYQFSQLYSYYQDPKDFLFKFRNSKNLEHFYNLKVGIAYTDATSRLSVAEILDCCAQSGMLDSTTDFCCMGVDQGKLLHVTISRRHPFKTAEVVHIGMYKNWEDLDPLMKKFKVIRCVVDAQPETRLARNFARRHKGKVYICYYNDNQKGSYNWNEKELMVTANRTESLDASHREVSGQKIVLPRESCEIVTTFAQQMHNQAKRLVEDENGNKKYEYVRVGGDDHFRHSFNYLIMAVHSSSSLIFAGMI